MCLMTKGRKSFLLILVVPAISWSSDSLHIERLSGLSDREKAEAYYGAETSYCTGLLTYIAIKMEDQEAARNVAHWAENLWEISHMALTKGKFAGQRRVFSNAAILSPPMAYSDPRFSKNSDVTAGFSRDLYFEWAELLSSKQNVDKCMATLTNANSDKTRKEFSEHRFETWKSWIEAGDQPPDTILREAFEMEPLFLSRYPQLKSIWNRD